MMGKRLQVKKQLIIDGLPPARPTQGTEPWKCARKIFLTWRLLLPSLHLSFLSSSWLLPAHQSVGPSLDGQWLTSNAWEILSWPKFSSFSTITTAPSWSSVSRPLRVEFQVLALGKLSEQTGAEVASSEASELEAPWHWNVRTLRQDTSISGAFWAQLLGVWELNLLPSNLCKREGSFVHLRWSYKGAGNEVWQHWKGYRGVTFSSPLLSLERPENVTQPKHTSTKF